MQPQQAIATWNPALDYWETPQQDIFGHSVAFSETLPKSGMTRNGQLFGLPTLVHPTTVPGYSSSPHLPTPRAAEAPQSMTAPGARRHVEKGMGGLTEVIGVRLLPTPAASDHKRDTSAPAAMARKSPGLAVAEKHFPTPRASDANGPGHHGQGGPDLRTAITELSSGESTPPPFDAGNE